MELSARGIAAVTGGRVVAGDPSAPVRSFSNDSRLVERGACFVALVGARDGHDYVADAFDRGATVALVTHDVRAEPPAGGAIVRVPDAFGALARLGVAARERLAGALVVGVTGSSGKTGTKDLTAAALTPKFHVHASPGSFNNEIGVPLTLLSAPLVTEALVVEMGARAPGNIRDLCTIALPTVGIVTNIGLADGGLLGGADGVARVKGELLEALETDGLAVLPAGDPATGSLRARTRARVLTVGVEGVAGAGADADVVATRLERDAELRPSFAIDSPWGGGTVRLAFRGDHHVVNAALAATVALAHGVAFDDVATALASVRPARGRMDVGRAPSGALLIDDAYNANPASTAAAVRALALAHVPGRTVAVLGEMLELGDDADAEHARIGALVAAEGVDALITVGPAAAALAAAARVATPPVALVAEVPDAAAALATLQDLAVGADDAVLVKGSRAVGLELVADTMMDRRGS